MDKADETAKIFIFDYQWLKNQAGGSQGLFKFETPGSTIIRKFLTNITSSVDGYNISMGFQNGGQIHSAIGLYKNTLDDKRFDFSFSTNDQKHFSLETGVNRSEIRHGHIYSPHFLLTINTQQVAGMIGHVKLHEKKNITQYDVDLRFETKKMQSSLNGSCIKNEASIRTKMLYTYKVSNFYSQIDLLNDINKNYFSFLEDNQRPLMLKQSLQIVAKRIKDGLSMLVQ